MAFGKNAKTHVQSHAPEPAMQAAKKRNRTHWLRGAFMALAVAVANVVYFALTGDSLPSPRYGALTRHGQQSNPGGAFALTAGMIIFAAFCYWMHRRQKRKEQGIRKQS
jgi:hypothetical protein